MADIEIPELRVGCDLRVERYRVEGRYDHPPLTREQALEVKRRAELYPVYQKLREAVEKLWLLYIDRDQYLDFELLDALKDVQKAESDT